MDASTHLRKQSIEKARQLAARRPVFFDTETTGVGPMDEVIEIGIVDWDGSVLLQSLIKPTNGIPLEATQVNKITNGMVMDAPRWSEVWPDIQQVFAGRLAIAYNADFDERLMSQMFTREEDNWEPPWAEIYDLMQLYSEFYGEWDSYRNKYKWHRLEAAGKQCEISLPNSHRASDDARLTRAVLEYMTHQEESGSQLSMF